jgi:hypothetical protein
MTPDEEKKEKKFTTGEVVGIVIGSILGSILLAFLIYFLVSHYNKENPFLAQ